MSQFVDITRYEFRMSVRRPGFWIAYALLGLFYGVTFVTPSGGASDIIPPEKAWSEAGHMVFMFNIFLPLLAGILSADRLQRDFRGSVHELQRSTPLSYPAYILAKFLGSLASVLLPFFVLSMGTVTILVALGQAPLSIYGGMLAAFLLIAVPSHAFVTAFSLAFPLVIPLRIYQVLFTGYWFWGNMISPKAFPTISDTVLNAIGQYPLQAFFSVFTDSTDSVSTAFTPAEAVLNLLLLAFSVAAALFTVNFYLRRQARRA